MLSKAFEGGTDVGDMGRGVGVEKLGVVKVGCYMVEVADDLISDLNEPAGRGAVVLRHDGPLEEPTKRADGCQGHCVLVDGNVVEGRHEIDRGEKCALCPKSRGPRRRVGWGVGQGS